MVIMQQSQSEDSTGKAILPILGHCNSGSHHCQDRLVPTLIYFTKPHHVKMGMLRFARKFKGEICCGGHLAVTYGGELLYRQIFHS